MSDGLSKNTEKSIVNTLHVSLVTDIAKQAICYCMNQLRQLDSRLADGTVA